MSTKGFVHEKVYSLDLTDELINDEWVASDSVRPVAIKRNW